MVPKSRGRNSIMEKRIQSLEEYIAILQAAMAALSDELYVQQREIARLHELISQLKNRLEADAGEGGIRRPEEEAPPPHY